MDENPAVILVRDNLTDLLLKTVYDDVVEVEYSNGTKGHLFTKFYQGEVVYFNDEGFFYLNGVAISKICGIDEQNIYRSLKNVLLSLTTARYAKSMERARQNIEEDRSRLQVQADSVKNKNSPLYHTKVLKIRMSDGVRRRHYKLYPAIFFYMLMGRAAKLLPLAVDFIEVIDRVMRLRFEVTQSEVVDAYWLGYQAGMQAQFDPYIELKTSQLIEVQQQLIETQRELSEAYRKLLQLQKTQMQDPLA